MAILKIKNKKGQYTLVGLFTTFLILVVFSALAPTISEVVTNTSNNLSGTAGIVVKLIPLGIVIAILSSIFIYARPYFNTQSY